MAPRLGFVCFQEACRRSAVTRRTTTVQHVVLIHRLHTLGSIHASVGNITSCFSSYANL